MNEAQTNAEIDPVADAEALTKWKNAPSVADLKADLLAADPAHQTQVKKVERWLDNLNVTGSAKIKSGTGRSEHVPKLIRKQAEWRYTALSEPFLNTYDLYDAQPVTWEDRESAEQNGLLLNYQINQKIDKVNFIDTYVRTAVDEGTAILRVGWDFEEATREVEQTTFEYVEDPEMAPVLQEVAQMQQENPNAYNNELPEELRAALEASTEAGIPLRAVPTGVETVEESFTVKNQPTLEVCDFRHVVIDPTCGGDLKKAKFIIFDFESNIADLKKTGKYKNLDKIRIGSESALAQSDEDSLDSGNFVFEDDVRKKLPVYEYWGYWDIEGDNLLVPFVSSWIGQTMIRLEESPFPDKQLPFVKVQYLPVRKKNHGEPDGELLEENQKIIGAVTRGMIDVMGRSANGQMATRKDALDTTNLRKFQRGQDYEFNPGVDPRQAFHMHTYPELPASAQYMLGMQNMDAEGLTGVQAFSQSGLSGASLGDTATSVNGVLDAAAKREAGILRRLAQGMVEVGRKFISMNAEFLDEEEIVRVTNDKFVPVRRDDLAGKIDLSLSISTAEEDNAKAKELAFMLQTTGPGSDPGEVRLLRAEIAKLRRMPDLAKKIEEYQPEPDPIDQEKRQLENELLRAEVEEKRAHAMERQAKAGLDSTKSANVQSDTDKKDLDYVEQESGVNQERELEKSKAQAQGNIELEREKSLLAQQDSALADYLKS